MKACIYIGGQSLDWVRNYFPDQPPGALPVAGKEWCVHLLDLLVNLGDVSHIYIADCHPGERISALAKRDGYWSTSFTYLEAVRSSSPWRLLQKNPRIPCDPAEAMLLFWGLSLPDLASPEELLQKLRPVDPQSKTLPPGVYLWQDGKFFACDCPMHHARSLQEYFNLNFRLLASPGVYTLPGYSGTPGYGFGRNVTTMPNCTTEPPLIVQDNAFLGRSLVLAGGVVVGKNSLIDDNTELRHTIVLNDTYVGKRLYLEDKIVSGNRVVDVRTGAYIDLSDEFLAKDSRRKLLDRFRLVGWLTALGLVALLTPIYLRARLFHRRVKEIAFFRLLFRIYPGCWKVLFWRANLIRVGDQDPAYAFRYMDRFLLPSTEIMRAQGDIYYQQHRTLSMMLGVVCRSLLKRMVQLSEPPQDLEEDALPQDYSVTLPFSAHYSPDETAIIYSDALPPVDLPPARRPPESRK